METQCRFCHEMAEENKHDCGGNMEKNDSFYLEGKLIIESRDHAVEYEPGASVGLGTLFIRAKNTKYVVPIYIDQIDDVIEMLQRGKRTIEALEGR